MPAVRVPVVDVFLVGQLKETSVSVNEGVMCTRYLDGIQSHDQAHDIAISR